jgi:hypothetical protein
MKDSRYAISSPHSQFCSFLIQVTPSIDTGKFGAETTGGHAPSISEVLSCHRGRKAVL